jgi:hypothetical protein
MNLSGHIFHQNVHVISLQAAFVSMTACSVCSLGICTICVLLRHTVPRLDLCPELVHMACR